MKMISLSLLCTLAAVAQSVPSPAPGASAPSAPASAPAAASATPAAASPAPNATAAAAPASAAVPAAVPLPDLITGSAYLWTGEKFQRLEASPVAITARSAFIKVLLIAKLPGESADTKIAFARPYLLIAGSTKGGHFLHLSVEHDPKDQHRETAIEMEGNPVQSDVVPFKEELLPEGWHKVTPISALKPGEYAWMPFGQMGAPMSFWDFSVTAAPPAK